MVRVNFSIAAIFLGLAVSSTALPTKASVPLPSSSSHGNQASVELAYEVLKVCPLESRPWASGFIQYNVF